MTPKHQQVKTRPQASALPLLQVTRPVTMTAIAIAIATTQRTTTTTTTTSRPILRLRMALMRPQMIRSRRRGTIQSSPRRPMQQFLIVQAPIRQVIMRTVLGRELQTPIARIAAQTLTSRPAQPPLQVVIRRMKLAHNKAPRILMKHKLHIFQ